ncbi:MAG TPA: hypothetical protein PLN21_02005 [Gemmatales bacterium]|nr:hypothetical protein [Gemmatales bacterium]
MTPATASALRQYLVMLAVLCSTVAIHADGGTVRLRERVGPYQVTVFSSPTPFRAGAVDVSVLLQDVGTGETVTNAQVMVRLTERASRRVLEQRATSEAATNKLYQAAVFILPEPGWWDVEFLIDGVKVHFAIEADQALPRWQELWYWYCWPALAVVLFGVHQVLIRRRHGKWR